MCTLIKLLAISEVGETEEQSRGIQVQRAVAVTSYGSTLVNKRNPDQEHQWVSGGGFHEAPRQGLGHYRVMESFRLEKTLNLLECSPSTKQQRGQSSPDDHQLREVV